ncbi:hypothetical protein AURDEDRAFT_144289 [Auricularia subglabra TFB-10046 SS5]|nr:hypothetical protein AURDEDRAFT_144289 [Auricularia subglabra TFB-10046 SS5]
MQLLVLVLVTVVALVARTHALPPVLPRPALSLASATLDESEALLLDAAVRHEDLLEEQEATLTLDALLANVDEDYPGLAGLAESLRLRGRLGVLRSWLEARAARGSVDAAVHQTLAVLSEDSRALAPREDAQTFLQVPVISTRS